MAGLTAALPLLATPDVSAPPLPSFESDFNFRVVDDLSATKVYTEVDAFGIGMSPANTPVIRPGRIISDVVHMQATVLPSFLYSWTVNEQIYVHDSLLRAFGASVADVVHVAPALSAALSITVLQGLGIAPTPLPSMAYTQTLVQGLAVSDALRKFFGASMLDGIGVTEQLAKQFLASPTVADGIGIAPALTQLLTMGVVLKDTTTIDDEQLLQMIFSGEILSDVIDVITAYVSPDGQFTTWSMNTRSGAVTEYTNYAFNSFARIGDDYFGASSTGLYQLIGDTDAGTNIIAELKSGYAQWGNSNFSMFKGMYLGVRGEGEWVIKLITGDGNTYNYAVSTRNQRTTKVHMGKGLRARYWAFDMISSGQDFDLDTIEFVPIAAQRRV